VTVNISQDRGRTREKEGGQKFQIREIKTSQHMIDERAEGGVRRADVGVDQKSFKLQNEEEHICLFLPFVE